MSDKDFLISFTLNIIIIVFLLSIAIYNAKVILKQRKRIKEKEHYISMYEDTLKRKEDK